MARPSDRPVAFWYSAAATHPSAALPYARAFQWLAAKPSVAMCAS